MKKSTLFQFLALFALFAIALTGCDEGMTLSEAVFVEPSETGVVESVIPDTVLAAMKIQADNMESWVKTMLSNPNNGLTPEVMQYIRANALGDTDFHAQQKAYYTKYIDAGGIAIVGPYNVANKDFLYARDIILVMTSKHPALRDRLLSEHGKFYMVLVDNWEDMTEIPELRLNGRLLNDDPNDDWLGASCSIRHGLGASAVGGFCYAPAWHRRVSRKATFAHEFAHALEWEIERLKPGFRDRLSEVYTAERGDNNVGAAHEFWAYGVEVWFFGIHEHSPWKTHADFVASYPQLAALLAEWFPVVSFPLTPPRRYETNYFYD